MSSSKLSQFVFGSLMTLLFFSVSVSAHMELQWPPGINSKYDPQTPQSQIDYSMTSPLSADGSNYPCKGYNTASNIAALNPVTVLKAGSTMNITLAGSATHGGGSCQFSFSYDQGKTFAVVASIIGGCPLSDTYDFPLPEDLPSMDKALFAWTWFNEIGNREQYIYCAVVSIDGTGTSYTGPSLFNADVFPDGSCQTVEGEDPMFPNPGPSVQYKGTLTASSPVTVLSPCSFDENSNVTVGPSGSSGASGSSTSVTGGSSTSVTGASSTSSTESMESSTSTSTSVTSVTSLSSTLVAAPTLTSASSASSTATATSATSAPQSSPSSSTGSVYIQCTSTTTFSLCVTGGECTVMGAVADGTTCVDGQITKKKSRRAHELMKKRLGAGHR